MSPSLVALAVGLLAESPSPAQGAGGSGYRRSVESYALPEVTLVDQDGTRLRLPQVLDPAHGAIVSFFFTTCTTVCPLLSASLATLQDRLGGVTDVRLVSIAIDPEHDTPERLRGYRERFGGAPGWEFLTGSREDIDRVARAFAAYAPNKMAHRPLSFLRAPGSATWLRLDGLASAADIAREYRELGGR